MPLLEYTLIINGSIEVDNAIHMLDEEGQWLLVEEGIRAKYPDAFWDADEINFEIIDD